MTGIVVSKYKFNIIYEDDSLFLVDKPSGLLTMQAPDSRAETLIDLVNKYFKKKGYLTRAYLCHRLDRDTSGIILLAKGKSVQRIMMDLFKERKIFKEYIAFVKGMPARQRGEIEYRINGQTAKTHYQIIKGGHKFSVLKLQPVTGRKNQIRLHLRKIGHPILGDRRFNRGRDFPVKFRRVALHAAKIVFFHPVTGKKMSFGADMPADMKKFLFEYQVKL